MTQKFALIGDPVAHSLSPVMHNVAYRMMGLDWTYEAICCPTVEDAQHHIDLVRTGVFRGMNITMPYKKLALDNADYADTAADAAGGANVLVRKGVELHAFNTDGLGAVGAIARAAGMDPRVKVAAVCGTGPTSCAIVTALVGAGAREVMLFSRSRERAAQVLERIALSLDPKSLALLTPLSYDDAAATVPGVDILVDATPRGMKPDDEPIIDPSLLHSGQVVLDVVYGHGETALLAGARSAGAACLDGFEMLVEQAALSIEIWEREMGLSPEVPRDAMRTAASDDA